MHHFCIVGFQMMSGAHMLPSMPQSASLRPDQFIALKAGMLTSCPPLLTVVTAGVTNASEVVALLLVVVHHVRPSFVQFWKSVVQAVPRMVPKM